MSNPSYDLRGQYAGFVSRLTAFLIDRGIIFGILAVTTALVSYLFELVGLSLTTCQYAYSLSGVVCASVQTILVIFTLSFAPLYTIIFWTLAGQTPGKYFLGLRIYRMDGQRMTLKRQGNRI